MSRTDMHKYAKEKYDMVRGYLPKGRKKAILEYCEIMGIESISRLINIALLKELGMSEEEWFKKEVDE